MNKSLKLFKNSCANSLEGNLNNNVSIDEILCITENSFSFIPRKQSI